MATLRRMGDLLSSEPFQYEPAAVPLKEAMTRELAEFHSQLLTNTGGAADRRSPVGPGPVAGG
jgi:hypothetical protein